MTTQETKLILMRLDRAIEHANRNEDQGLLDTLLEIRNGKQRYGPVDRGSNVARLHDRERKMNGW